MGGAEPTGEVGRHARRPSRGPGERPPAVAASQPDDLANLALCSIVTVGYAGSERLVALRRDRVIPRDFVERFLDRLSSGKLDRDRAGELCRANDSPVARIFGLVVNYWGQPAATIRQAIGYDAGGELVDLKRNVRVLNATATLAPLLGLLGTVIGMIQSFDALGGRVGPARGEALAQGISLALVSTAFGLSIAVVSVAAYYYLLNRVDLLVRELDEHARRVVDLVASEAIPAGQSGRPPVAAAVPAAQRSSSSRHETRVARLRSGDREEFDPGLSRNVTIKDRARCSGIAISRTSCRTST